MSHHPLARHGAELAAVASGDAPQAVPYQAVGVLRCPVPSASPRRLEVVCIVFSTTARPLHLDAAQLDALRGGREACPVEGEPQDCDVGADGQGGDEPVRVEWVSVGGMG